MISFDEALASVLASAEPLVDTEIVALDDCLGRYLADGVLASIDVPSFNNSAMDGYAVCIEDIVADQRYRVSQRIPAGTSPTALEPGTVARIFTGAKIPEGANAVILQEDSVTNEKAEVEFVELPRHMQHIRPRGQDVPEGALVVSAGRRIQAADIALIASVGVSHVRCFKQIRVAFFSTGDELKQPGEKLDGAQIYNSNRFLLAALISELGMLPIDLGVCDDNRESTRQMLLQATGCADVLLTTGGMSVGEEDYVRVEAEALGQLEFWKIAMKPGKPFAMGQLADNVRFFGLPGNPVSTFVTFQLFVRPWLLKASGAPSQMPIVKAKLLSSVKNRGRRLDFMRASLSGRGGNLEVALYDNQSSGVLSSVAASNSLLPVPPGTEMKAGQLVDVWLFDAVAKL